MTLLQQAVKAQQEDGFIDWYSSLSKEEQEQFNVEFQQSVESLIVLLGNISEFIRNVLPSVIESLTQSFYEFGKAIKK